MVHKMQFSEDLGFIVKPVINWALSNSLNAYDRHSDWKPKLEVYATNVSIYF